MQRRTFLQRLSSALAGLVALALAVPGVAVVVAPLTRKTRSDGFRRIASLAEVPIGRPSSFPIRETVVDAWTRHPAQAVGAVWLIRREDGSLTALSDICPHAGCNIVHDAASKEFFCPCHKASFTFTGEKLLGPAKRGMGILDVKVENGAVHVRWQEYRIGIGKKVPIA